MPHAEQDTDEVFPPWILIHGCFETACNYTIGNRPASIHTNIQAMACIPSGLAHYQAESRIFAELPRPIPFQTYHKHISERHVQIARQFRTKSSWKENRPNQSCRLAVQNQRPLQDSAWHRLDIVHCRRGSSGWIPSLTMSRINRPSKSSRSSSSRKAARALSSRCFRFGK